MKVRESDFGEKAETLRDLGKDVARDGFVPPGEGDFFQDIVGCLDGEGGEEGEAQGFLLGLEVMLQVNRTGGFVEAASVAIGAGDEFLVGGAIEFAFVVEFGLGFGVVAIGFGFGMAVGSRRHGAVAAAGLAPTSRGVEGEVGGIEFLEGASGGGGDPRGGEDVELVFLVEEADGAFADAEGGGEVVLEGEELGLAGNARHLDVDVVFLEAGEALKAIDGFPLLIDEETGVAMTSGPLGDIGVVAFAATNDGGEEGGVAGAKVGAERFENGVLRLCY